MELLNRIQEAQNGNNDASLLLIKKFNPLLKKYAKKLGYDDAYNDLLVDFLSVIKKNNLNRLYNPSDGAIVLYFSKSVYLSYIHKSKALYKYVHTISPLSTLNKEEQYHVEVLLSSLDSHEMLETISLQEILNRNEWFIIFNIYYVGFSPADIARELGTSRQAINQLKLRALKKLKHAYLTSKIG